MLATKDIYLKACHSSSDLHEINEEELKSLQSHLRKMYLEIEKVCVRHNLTMMVAYGSALGALRHQGFIPWDDDMDLLMPRADFDKLLEYKDELPSHYKFYSPASSDGVLCRFGKIVDTSTRMLGMGEEDSPKHGIFVDIFVLENASTNLMAIQFKRMVMCALMLISSSVQTYRTRSIFYKNLMCSTKSGKRVYQIRNLIGKLFSFWKEDKWFRILERVSIRKKESGFYCVPVGGASKKYFMPVAKDIYVDPQRMKFDDIEVYVPNKTEQHCEYEYGNWRAIPKEEDRWKHFINTLRFNVN